MSLETQVMSQMKEAMKSKNEAALRSLRAIKAAIILAKTSEGAGGEVTADAELKLLQKLVKQRRDSVEIFKAQGRNDLADKELEEIEVISSFLPSQLEGEALEQAVKAVIAETGATGPADMGKVMGAATKALAGRADGKAISALVKQLLAGG
ncbi:MAG: GatB/YqeY domain-containing protein [Chitinophagaceae bacterium]|nr:GatB/YqeY domain-containing protein [Chitinophagaceae bacterium]